MTLDERLHRGLAALDLDVMEEDRRRLLDYLELLQKWNRVYNLTAVRDRSDMLSQHLFDSLAVVPHLRPGRLLDVGSGAGLPGIPIALVRPQMTVTLLDANQKKAAFLRQAVIELGVGNAAVASARAETWQPEHKFDTVISRAFASIGDFIAAAGRLVVAGGRLVAMKGGYPREELNGVPAEFRIESVVSLAVPELHAERHLVFVEAA